MEAADPISTDPLSFLIRPEQQLQLYLSICLTLFRTKMPSIKDTDESSEPELVSFMHLELKAALDFIESYLSSNIQSPRLKQFMEELEQVLLSRYEGHWYLDNPQRGSAFRCLHFGGGFDPAVHLAATKSGLGAEKILRLPQELCIWIDPYEVSYRMGDRRPVVVLYKSEKHTSNLSPHAMEFVPSKHIKHSV